jgi:hypothetical protein
MVFGKSAKSVTSQQASNASFGYACTPDNCRHTDQCMIPSQAKSTIVKLFSAFSLVRNVHDVQDDGIHRISVFEGHPRLEPPIDFGVPTNRHAWRIY